MLDTKTIGYITLNISFVVYLALFLPQLIHNQRYRSTQALSLLMHYVMFVAYMLDLLYGFGRHMQWQYKTVSIVGLCSLAIQHIQIYRYSGFSPRALQHYIICTILLLGLLVGVVYGLTVAIIPPSIVIGAGGVTQMIWLVYVVPQIIKNHMLKSTIGISIHFVLLTIFLGICYTISAWALGWDWPSKIGPAVGIAVKLVLLYQFFKYSSLHNRYK